MNYDKHMTCSPFAISQIGEMQNEYLLLPSCLAQKTDSFSKVIYYEIEKNRITDSFFRVVSFEEYVVIIHYWATTHREAKSGRTGLFIICGLIVPKDEFIKNISEICLLSSTFFQILDSYNTNPFYVNSFAYNKDNNDGISFPPKEQLNSQYSSKHIFEKDYNSDVLWEIVQNNSENVSIDILNRYIQASKQSEANDRSKEKKSFLSIIKLLLKKCRVKKKNTHQKQILPRTAIKTGLILLDEDSDKNRIGAFLQESCLILKKRRTIDVSSLQGVFPSSICFLKDQSEVTFNLLFGSSVIEKCNYDGIRYIKFLREKSLCWSEKRVCEPSNN